jgi:hypothetical protein
MLAAVCSITLLVRASRMVTSSSPRSTSPAVDDQFRSARIALYGEAPDAEKNRLASRVIAAW